MSGYMMKSYEGDMCVCVCVYDIIVLFGRRSARDRDGDMVM